MAVGTQGDAHRPQGVPKPAREKAFQGTLGQNGATGSTLQIPLQPNYSLSIALQKMLYESIADGPF